MGVLNITPDSFSDGGKYTDVDKALSHAREMIDAGAKIIDVGGESTRPGSEPVEWREEWSRIEDVVRELCKCDVCVSVDTRHFEVAKRALECGASIINDVSGFADPNMLEVAKTSDCGLVVMHMRGTPQTMQDNCEYTDVVAEVATWLDQKTSELEKSGIEKERICVDPGPGFAKTPEDTYLLFRNMHEFRRLGYFVLAAPSRKRYLSLLSDREGELTLEQKDNFTADECLRAAESGCSAFRVPNVEVTRDRLKDLRPLVVLSLGSNVALVGDNEQEKKDCKISQINLAIQEFIALPDTDIIDVSDMYESEAAYYEDQDNFVNAIVVLRCGIPPLELLDYLHVIENALGRVREIDKGPRTIDIDIVDYQMYVCKSEKLTLPHACAVERDFVVEPLSQVLPNHVLADGTKIDAVPREERFGKCWKI